MYGDLNLFFLFYGFIYAPLGGVILTFIESKFKLSKPILFLISIVVTVLAFLITMLWVFSL